MMQRPLCLKCNVEMKPKKNGVMVAETAGDSLAGTLHFYCLTAADLLECPVCGYEIVANYASRPAYHDVGDRALEGVVRNLLDHDVPIYLCHEIKTARLIGLDWPDSLLPLKVCNRSYDCRAEKEGPTNAHGSLDETLTHHRYHCPRCDVHLTSLLLCSGCGTRYRIAKPVEEQR